MIRHTDSVPRRCLKDDDVDFGKTFDILAIFLVPPGLTLEYMKRRALLPFEDVAIKQNFALARSARPCRDRH